MIKRIAIIGSKTYPDRERVYRFVQGLPPGTTVVSGGADGVDSYAEDAAKEAGLKTDIYHADWAKLGRRAGPVRNEQIVANADQVVAFWDGESRGTCNCLVNALRAGLPIEVFDANGNRISEDKILEVAESSGVLDSLRKAKIGLLENP